MSVHHVSPILKPENFTGPTAEVEDPESENPGYGSTEFLDHELEDDIVESDDPVADEVDDEPLSDDELRAAYGDWCNDGRGFGADA